jgi:hypothetical protein
VAGVEKNAIYINNENDIRSDEETGVTMGLHYTMFLQMFGEVLKEVTGSLFKTVERLLQFQHVLVTIAHVNFETTGLMNVDFFVGREVSVNECSGDVSLGRLEVKDGGEDKHEPHS